MKKIVKALSLTGFVLLGSGIAYAQGGAVGVSVTGASNCSANGSFISCIQYLLGWAVGIAGIIFVVMFLIGGIQYLTSAGNEEASTKAKKLLIDAVIGIIITTIAWLAARWILAGLGTPSQI